MLFFNRLIDLLHARLIDSQKIIILGCFEVHGPKHPTEWGKAHV